jgi:hypothetical protein
MRDRTQDWIVYFAKRLVETENELAGFKEAIDKYGLRICHRDFTSERDVTDEEVKHLENKIEEFRRMLRDD